LLFVCASAEALPRWSMLANEQLITLDVARTGRNYHAATHDALDLWSLPWEALPCPGTGVLPAGSPLVDLARRADGKFDVTIQRVLLVPVGEEGPGTDPVNGCVFQEAHYVGEFTDRAGALAFDATQLGKFPADDDSFLVLTKIFDSCPIPVANRHTCLGGRFPWNPIIDAPLVDTDGDGLFDEWELNGVRAHGQFLDLRAMGADPDHKDLFVQLDATPWTRFESDVLEAIADDMAREPIPNPDVQPGISIHLDAGPDSVMDRRSGRTWGALSRANETLSLPDHFGRFIGGCDHGEFDNSTLLDLMHRRLDPIRQRVFRYAVVVKYLGPSCALGVTPFIPARAFAIANYLSNGTPVTRYQEHGIFLHELGHALGLRHGGDSDLNFKPNYQSVMNYLYTEWGIPRFGDHSPGAYHYSNALPSPLNTLDETHLDESLGFKPVVPEDAVLKFKCRSHGLHRIQPLMAVDMDCDGRVTAGQRAIDVTPEEPNTPPTRLRTFDDLNHLQFAVPRRDADGAGAHAIETMTPDELAQAEASAFDDRELPTARVTLRSAGTGRIATIVAHDDVSLASATITVGTFRDVERLSGVDHFVRDATRNVRVPASGAVTVVVGDAFGKSATVVAH
jgi:hypothetical protein